MQDVSDTQRMPLASDRPADHLIIAGEAGCADVILSYIRALWTGSSSGRVSFLFQSRLRETEKLEMSQQRIREYPLMMSKSMAFAAIAAIALSTVVLGQDQDLVSTLERDPVALNLLKDIATFNAGLKTIRRPVNEQLRKTRQEAQARGDLHKLEAATQDINAFENSDKLPATFKAAKPELTKQFRRGYEELLEKMVNDFKVTIQEYTRQDKVTEAKAVEELLEKFKAAVRTPPPSWKNDAKKQPSRKRRKGRR